MELSAQSPNEAQRLNERAMDFLSRGDYEDALPLLERALGINEESLGPQHPVTALSLNNLAFLYDSIGEFAMALPLYQRALAICEKSDEPFAQN